MRNRNAWTRPNAGFTLVELLAVMAVITVLAAVVTPIVYQARNKGRAAQCLANLKQLGAAVMLYADDNDGRLPYASGSVFAGGWSVADMPDGTASTCASRALEPYLKSTELLVCPNDRGAPAFGFPLDRKLVWRTSGTSYLWNMARTKRGWVANGRRVGALDPAAVLALFQDYGSNWHGARVRRGLDVLDEAQCNAVYADGHTACAMAYSFSTSSGSYSASAASRSGSDGRITVAGCSDYGAAFLSGAYRFSSGSAELIVELSGDVFGESGERSPVERVFTFSGSMDVRAALHQILHWVEGLIVQ